jgi:hypothetical protein
MVYACVMSTEPDYDRMPLVEADRRIQEQINSHRKMMARLRRRRGQRLQLELDAGRSATEVAAEIGTSAQVVYELTREVRRHQPSPTQWWEELSSDDQTAFAAAARRPLGLAEDLATKLRDSGVLVAYVGWQGQEMKAVFPQEYAAHALAPNEPLSDDRQENQAL